MDHEIEVAPSLGNLVEYRLHLAWHVGIERHQDWCFQFACQRNDVFLGLVVEIGDCKLCTESTEGLGAAPCDRVLVRDANDKPPLAFEQLGFHGRDHRHAILSVEARGPTSNNRRLSLLGLSMLLCSS